MNGVLYSSGQEVTSGNLRKVMCKKEGNAIVSRVEGKGILRLLPLGNFDVSSVIIIQDGDDGIEGFR